MEPMVSAHQFSGQGHQCGHLSRHLSLLPCEGRSQVQEGREGMLPGGLAGSLGSMEASETTYSVILGVLLSLDLSFLGCASSKCSCPGDFQVLCE